MCVCVCVHTQIQREDTVQGRAGRWVLWIPGWCYREEAMKAERARRAGPACGRGSRRCPSLYETGNREPRKTEAGGWDALC